ncbi:MAG: 2-aminoethylphosphonate--pyruvate transaminase [Elusimicrobiota bacterium]
MNHATKKKVSAPHRHGEKLLFTPGPLTTSLTVKQAMLRDLGSRDQEFTGLIREIREQLLRLAGVGEPEHTCVLMQGSGTFAVEAVLSSVIPAQGKLLVIANGAYGTRMAQIAKTLKISTQILEFAETDKPSLPQVNAALWQDRGITHVGLIHCETTSGIINPVEEIGALAAKAGKIFIVDAMSSFGAMPLDMEKNHIHYLVSSANKCIEGVPGFAFVLARRECLEAASGLARSVSLDLSAQAKELDRSGQFRFTPPTHALAAFGQALRELEEEGGIKGRQARYRSNYETLVQGMRALGFRELLPESNQGYIITSFLYPKHPDFRFEDFYARLNQKNFVIYPGKVSRADCFRIGSIGRIFPEDVRALLAAILESLNEMRISLEVSLP